MLLKNYLRLIYNKLNNLESKIRVNFESTEDIGIVTHYKGKPFSGIVYNLNNKGELKDEVQMVSGLKHGNGNRYDFQGNLTEQNKYIDDFYCGKQISFCKDGKIRREFYYEKGNFIKSIHYDNNGNKIDGFDWFNGDLQEGVNIKIRKFAIDGVQSYSPMLIWLKSPFSSVFMHLYANLIGNAISISNSTNEIESKDYNDIHHLKDLILKLKINYPIDYNQIFHDTSIDDLTELSQYRMLLHPSFNADIIAEGTPITQLFKQQYLKIIKSHNKKHNQWMVFDCSIKPIGIVYQSNLKSDCKNWIDAWEI